MPITKITIENFKGIRDRVEIPLRPITLLFGGNSAGKSTILQALLFLRELLDRQNADADRLMASGESIDLGGFRQFVHGHDLKRKVVVGVEVAVDADGLPAYLQSYTDPYTELTINRLGTVENVTSALIEVEVSYDEDKQRPAITGYHVSLNGRKIGSIKGHPGLESILIYFDTEHPHFCDFDDEGVPESILSSLLASILSDQHDTGEYEISDFDIPVEGGVIPKWGQPFRFRDRPEKGEDADSGERYLIACYVLTQIFVGAGELVLDQLKDIRHIGSFRDIPKRQHERLRSPAHDRWANGSAAWDLLYETEADWFDEDAFESLGLGYKLERYDYFEIPAESAVGAFLSNAEVEDEIALSELESLPIRREMEALQVKRKLRLIDTRSGVDVDPCDVGVGVSQVVPVVLGSMAPGYSVLSVEQPELHIHPAVQCALGDVLANQVIGSTERCLLLETHSEHLMLRWLRRIREGNEQELPPGAPAIKPEHLSVIYVESTEDGQKITLLPVSEDGEFATKWPRGFFDERAEELF